MKANLVLFLAALMIALAGAELTLRMIGRFAPPPYPPRPRQPELYEANPAYGYALRPSRTATYDYPPDAPRTITVRADAYGFRNSHDISARDGRLRVLVLGDSYTFGEGVQEDERFTHYLQAQEPGWRVDNIGIPGYGPDLMLLALQAMLPVAKPDVVLVVLFYDDFRRVRPRYSGMGYPNPRFRLRDGKLEEVGFPKPKLWERTHLYTALLLGLYGKVNPYARLTAAEWELNEAIQDSLITLAEAYEFTPVYVYLSGPWTDRAQTRRRAWVKGMAARRGAAFIDLTEPIQSADTALVYLPANTHYGPEGHRIVADSLHAFLVETLEAAQGVMADDALEGAAPSQQVSGSAVPMDGDAAR